MKTSFVLLLPIVLALPGCQPPVVGEEIYAQNHFVPFTPPQGDPRYPSSWRLKGPGTVIRKTHYEVEYDARNVLGQDHLAKIAADANNPTERIPFEALSNKRTSGNSFDAHGGWTVEGATEIKGKLNLENASSVDIQFGDTWIAEITENELRKAPGTGDISRDTRRNLAQGKSHVILKTVYSDSLKIYFKSVRSGGGEVGLKIPLQDQMKLGGNYKVTEDGGVEVSGPIIVGYVPLSREGVTQLFPRR